MDDGDADVVGALLDRKGVDAVLHLLPLHGRPQFAALVERHAGVQPVCPGVTVAVRGVRRGVVREALRHRSRQRREQRGFGLLGVLDPRKIVVAALPQLDVVLQRIVETLPERPDLQRVLRRRKLPAEQRDARYPHSSFHGIFI